MLAEKLAIWREEFLEEGRQEEEARVLLRQIERKFGAASPEVRKRVESASTDDLLRWADRVLAAGSLDDLFRH